MNGPKVFIKLISLITASAFLFMTLYPTASWALTNGPVQIEYTGYEANASDMVQLLTGDMSYSVPMLNVPSPEGGFSFPLSYHSGIQMEQEASWVGLGWSLNVGAINRTVSQFPDDFKGSLSVNKYKDPGESGWTYNFLLGTVIHNNNNKGNGGTLNLGILQFGWGSQQGFTALGISFKKGEKTSFSALGFALGVASLAANIAIPGAGASLAAIGIDAAVSVGVSAVAQAIIASSSPGGTTLNVNNWTVKNPGKKVLKRNEYAWYLDHDEYEKMYGSLYLGDVTGQSVNDHPTYVYQQNTAQNPFNVNNRAQYQPKVFPAEATTDAHMNFTANELGKNSEPSHVAYDNYSVLGKDVSGAIKPYRHDMGSLAYAHRNATKHIRYNAVKYLSSGDYKVNFDYVGEMANQYRHHVTEKTAKDLQDLDHGFGLSVGRPFTGRPDMATHFAIKDAKLLDNNAQKTEGNRLVGEGLKNDHLAGSKYIQWYSNTEILNGTALVDGFIDMEYNDMTKTEFRSARPTGAPIPGEGIGGFKVVSANGTTYHYGMPVYNYSHQTYTGNAGVTKYTERTNSTPFAVTWLLTAITGPDFYDRGGTNNAADGIVDENDWGAWVKFDYRKFSGYKYSSPYHDGTQYSPDNDENGFSRTDGAREIYFLDKIQTRTHTALFIKDVRHDARSRYTYIASEHPTSKLKLDEIILLTNEDYDALKGTPYSLARNVGGSASAYDQLQRGEAIDKLYDVGDITSTMRTNFINDHQLQRIVFDYDYSLCDGVYNSFEYVNGVLPTLATSVGKKGKLTLNSISIYGKGNKKVMPDYDFYYSDKTANYNPHKWDKWGMYDPNALNYSFGHDYVFSTLTNRDEDYWHLKKIVTPSGSEILIDYERDSYYAISGHKLAGQQKSINSFLDDDANNKITFATNLNLDDFLDVNDLIYVHNWKYKSTVGTPIDYSNTYTISAINGNSLTLSNFPNLVGTPTETSYINVVIPSGGVDGGDVRVKEITVKDELDNVAYENTTKYEYNLIHDPQTSSGVCSMEPLWSRTTDYDFYNYFDYPFTPVYYQNVTVYDGVKSNGDYISKKEYEFETPHEKHYELNRDLPGYIAYNYYTYPALGVQYQYEYETHMYNFRLYSNLAAIGRMNAQRQYNNQGHLMNAATYHYIDKNNFPDTDKIPGLRTEGSWMTFRAVDSKYDDDPHYKYHIHFNRTNKVYYPNVLDKIDVTQDGYSYTIANTAYDMVTGNILEQEYKNSLGYVFKSQDIQAHDEYPEMGSKVDDPSNRNMMSQSAGQYLYAQHPKSKAWEPISAGIQTWSKGWEDNTSAWRKQSSYIWDSEISKNGIFATSPVSTGNPAYSAYSFGSANPGWLKVAEVTKYDANSMPLESLSGEDYYAATRRDNQGIYVIASASNARYGEFTYSGAERELNASSEYDGGLTKTGTTSRKEASTIDTDPGAPVVPMEAHTGEWVYEIPQSSKLAFESSIGDATSFIPEDKVYRLSYWQHEFGYGQTEPTLTIEVWGAVFVGGEWGEGKVKTITTTLDQNNIANCGNTQFGEWHLVNADVTIDTDKGYELRVYLENPASNPIYIDDYRFLPLDASMSATVIDYDRGDSRVTATLDDNNIGTKYEYYENVDFKLGKLKKVKREYMDQDYGATGATGVTGLGGFKLVQEKDYNVLDH